MSLEGYKQNQKSKGAKDSQHTMDFHQKILLSYLRVDPQNNLFYSSYALVHTTNIKDGYSSGNPTWS